MNLGLNGRRALVTGSTSGLGIAIATILAREGAIVVVHGRDRSRGEKVVTDIRKTGGSASLALGDLTSDAGAEAVADLVLRELGGLDVLINNAGGKDSGSANESWMDVDSETWVNTYQMNVVAAARLIRKFVPGMQERKWGRVINIASAAATTPTPSIPDYPSAKAAMVAMSVSLSKAVGNDGVTVNTLSPGKMRTDVGMVWLMNVARQMGWGDDQKVAERRFCTEMMPTALGRIGEAEDIGNAAAFLASDLAGYITGAHLRVDGGLNRSIN